VTPKEIEAVEIEAKRFLARVKAAKAAFTYHKYNAPLDGGYWSNGDTKATGALRRASMDLTRALAELRKP
jgi:hypothetical protein